VPAASRSWDALENLACLTATANVPMIMCLCSLEEFFRKRSWFQLNGCILSTTAIPDLASRVCLAQRHAHRQFEQQHSQLRDYLFW
jgi:hypothetical protein